MMQIFNGFGSRPDCLFSYYGKNLRGGAAVQWLALSLLPVQSLHVFPYSAADFLPQCKNMHATLIGESKL